MILYHGSNIDIDKIDLTKSKPYKDFGKGFYLSADKQQAQRMQNKGHQSYLKESLHSININLMRQHSIAIV